MNGWLQLRDEADGTMACSFRRQVSPSLATLVAIDKMIVMRRSGRPELPRAKDYAHCDALIAAADPMAWHRGPTRT